MGNYTRNNNICAPAMPGGGDDHNNSGNKSACQWLDDYIAFSRKWSPEAYDGFHEASGLFVLSTVAARRVGAVYGGVEYPSLYIALVGRTTLFAKSTTAQIAVEVLREAGLGWMLAPDSSTPERFVSDLGTSSLPENFHELSDEARKRILMSALFSAQKGWCYEEFGMNISNMMTRKGVMSKYHGLFRVFHDNLPTYEAATISRGKDSVKRPYLSLLATLTPADLQPYAGRDAPLWGDGYLARFSLITPNEGSMITETFPSGKRNIPIFLTKPLQMWHQRLGVPEYEILEDGDDKYVHITSWPEKHLEMTEHVRKSLIEYRKDLREKIDKNDLTDLDGNYGRFPEKALRIATLLASISGTKTINWLHWDRGRRIAERWRSDLHNLYGQLNAEALDNSILTDEEKVNRQIEYHGERTIRELSQNTKLPVDVIRKVFCNLMSREYYKREVGNTVKYGYRTRKNLDSSSGSEKN